MLHLLFKAADLETTTLSQCPPGTWRKAGVVSGQNCFACLPGTFAELVNQDSCTKCQASRFSTKFQATSRVVCQQCPKGSYWPMTGARVQHDGGSDDCRDIGGYVCACGTANCTDQRVCTTCEAGRNQSKESERSCIECKPGTYREQEGGTSEMSCTRCDTGTFDFVKVGPNNDQYVYGTTKLVETCEFRPVDCKLFAAGCDYSANGGSFARGCFVTSSGSFACACGSVADKCDHITNGSSFAYAHGSFVTSSRCSAYNGGSLAARCDNSANGGSFACACGSVADKCDHITNGGSFAYARSCTKCQTGRFSKKFQATSRVACQQCLKGSYWPMTGTLAQHVGGPDDCRDIGGNVCAYGTADFTDQRVCSTCEAGRYQSKVGERSCIDCEPGTYREQEGGTSEMSRTRCDVGTFDFVKVGTNNDRCVYGAPKLIETCADCADQRVYTTCEASRYTTAAPSPPSAITSPAAVASPTPVAPPSPATVKTHSCKHARSGTDLRQRLGELSVMLSRLTAASGLGGVCL